MNHRVVPTIAAACAMMVVACKDAGPPEPADPNYTIVVRFFDDSSMTSAQKALFVSAAERIMGIVTSGMPDVQFTNRDISSCLQQPESTTVLTEIVDDIVIYATIDSIDGPGQVLASAGPCFIRTGVNNKIPVLGMVRFDKSDLPTLTGNGSLQEVITHEMLHLLGHGYWGTCESCFGFITGSGTADPLYNQPAAKAACLNAGGSATCLNGVPLENTGGSGTREMHWRETTFGKEMMTPFINTSPNPLSAITTAALVDIGYTVNAASTDAYSLAAIMANLGAPNFGTTPRLPPNWEKLDGVPLYSIDGQGNAQLVRQAR